MKRLSRRISFALLAVAMLGSGAVLAKSLVLGSAVEATPSRTKTEPRPEIQPTGEEVTIGSGQTDGQPWTLKGYPAHMSNGDSFQAATCVTFLIEGSENEAQCITGIEEAAEKLGLVVEQVSANGPPIFGEVASTTTLVEVKISDGSGRQALLFPAPESLGLDAKFFVYPWAAEAQDLRLVAKDQSGTVVGEQQVDHYPVLTVEKTGGGTGEVDSYYTDLLGTKSEADAPWIHCGDVCSATLVGARVTLKSSPAPGSIFLGWSGDCSGLGDCVLTVDTDKSVTAQFQAAP